MIRPHPVSYRLRRLAFAAVWLAAVGCGGKPSMPPGPPPPTVTVTRPVPFQVQSYHEYNGYLDAVETVQIRARVKGILTEVKFNKNDNQKEGSDVTAGDDLYTIDPREYVSAVKRSDADIRRAEADIAKADADIAAAEAQFKSASGTVARLKRVGGSVSGDELDKAIAAATTGEANIKVAEASKKIAEANRTSGVAARDTAQLNVEYTKIKAPISGRISRTLVTPGNLVGQTDATLLTTIVRMDKLYIYFDAPERDLVEQLRTAGTGAATGNGVAAVIPVEIGVATEDGFPHNGEIDFRENRVDQGTGTIRVRGKLDNPLTSDGKDRQLYSGMFARIRVPAGAKRNLVVLPEEALMTGQEGSYVYVVGQGNVVQKRSVMVVSGPPVWRTPANGGTEPVWSLINPKQAAGTPPTPLRSVVAIEKGLTDQDVVIVNGLQKARPAAPVTPEEWAFRAPPPPPKK